MCSTEGRDLLVLEPIKFHRVSENLNCGAFGFRVEQVVAPGAKEGRQGGGEAVAGGHVVRGVGRGGGVVARHAGGWWRGEVLGGGRRLRGKIRKRGSIDCGEGRPLATIFF